MYLNKKVNRESTIELLRIMSMIMILAHHYIFYGIQQNYNSDIAYGLFANGSNTNKIISNLLLPGGVVGVSLFFLIAGYFGINSNKIKLDKIVIPVLFYSLLGLLIFTITSLFQNQIINNLKIVIITSIFPIGNEMYWFATAYILLILLKPVINHFIKSLNTKLIMTFIFILFWEYFFSRTYLLNYLPLIEAVFLYTVGAFIRLRKDNLTIENKNFFLLLFAFCWLGYTVLTYLNYFEIFKITVFGTVSAIGLFIFMILSKVRYRKIINLLGSLTFDVYLIHEYPYLREIFWEKIFKSSLQYKNVFFPVCSILTILVAFLFCCLIAFICRKLVINKIFNKWMYVKERVLIE